MVRLVLCFFLCGCLNNAKFEGRAPDGAPEYLKRGAWAWEYKHLGADTRWFGERVYSVVISEETMLEYTGGISAWGLSRSAEPLVFFVRRDVATDPLLMCKVSLHEQLHLMMNFQYSTMDGGHCDDRYWDALMAVQYRICGANESNMNHPKNC